MEFDQSYVWITTRRLKPGSREEFSRAWRPREFPEGMVRAYECYAPDGNEVVGISIWDSPESRDRFRLSEVEAERREAMAPLRDRGKLGLLCRARAEDSPALTEEGSVAASVVTPAALSRPLV
jgi:heme-degrading monooxygenase HmoA